MEEKKVSAQMLAMMKDQLCRQAEESARLCESLSGQALTDGEKRIIRMAMLGPLEDTVDEMLWFVVRGNIDACHDRLDRLFDLIENTCSL